MTPLDLVFDRLNTLELHHLSPDEYERVQFYDPAEGLRLDNRHPTNIFYTVANFSDFLGGARLYAMINTKDIYMRRIIKCEQEFDNYGGGIYCIFSKKINNYVKFKLINTDFDKDNQPGYSAYTIAVLYQLNSKEYPSPVVLEIADVSIIPIDNKLILLNRSKCILPEQDMEDRSLACGKNAIHYNRNTREVDLTLDRIQYDKLDEKYKMPIDGFETPRIILQLDEVK